ncbi:MAG: MmcQ/YjbR family DNA-binding protein [Hyphomonas sp.]
MTLEEYNDFCSQLPHTTHVVQWGGSHVWKVGGKLFVVGSVQDDNSVHCSFKVTDMSFDILKDQPGCRGAPYLASRGMKWIQRTSAETLSTAELKSYLEMSHQLVAAGLTKKRQRELGFL